MSTNVLSTDENSASFMKIDATSIAAGAGTTAINSTDYTDAAFASPPSIGAFEVSGAGAGGGSVAGLAAGVRAMHHYRGLRS